MLFRIFLGLFVLALAALPLRDSRAHPHIWIDVVSTFEFKEGKVTGLRVRWTFDEFFSAGIIHHFDKDKSGSFDDAETASLQKGAFEATQDDSYFTHIKINDARIRLKKVQSYKAEIFKSSLVMEFVAQLPEPVDPSKDKITVSVFDSTYYVDVAFEKLDPVRFSGEQNGFCTFKMLKDKGNPIYFNSVHPQLLELVCTGE